MTTVNNFTGLIFQRSLHIGPGPPNVTQKEPSSTGGERIFTGQIPFLSTNQQCQSTKGITK